MKRSVLFIGNSYTYFNTMPNMVAQLACDAGDELVWEMVAPGGWRLSQHSGNPATLETIDKAMWTDVILQDHSLGAVEASDALQEHGAALVERVQGVGGRPVLYLTWARRHIPEMQEQINEGYSRLAEASGAVVAPVGMAWQRALSEVDSLVLHTDDQSHPNPTGSYLAACVFYSVLFNRSPIDLTGVVEIPDADLLRLDGLMATQLQTIAWETVQRVSGRGASD